MSDANDKPTDVTNVVTINTPLDMENGNTYIASMLQIDKELADQGVTDTARRQSIYGTILVDIWNDQMRDKFFADQVMQNTIEAIFKVADQAGMSHIRLAILGTAVIATAMDNYFINVDNRQDLQLAIATYAGAMATLSSSLSYNALQELHASNGTGTVQ